MTRRCTHILNGSPADVIRITFAQLVREAVCFLGVTRLAKCHRSFVQRARSDGWIVIKQGDSCYIGPNESREIVNRGNEVCTIAVAVAPVK